MECLETDDDDEAGTEARSEAAAAAAAEEVGAFDDPVTDPGEDEAEEVLGDDIAIRLFVINIITIISFPPFRRYFILFYFITIILLLIKKKKKKVGIFIRFLNPIPTPAQPQKIIK